MQTLAELEPLQRESIIVADSGPLIGLARAGGLHLLHAVFHQVIVPTPVAEECCRDLALPGAQALRHAIDRHELQVVVPPKETPLVWPPGLGVGERAATSLALAMRTGLLIDDLPARRFAKRHGIAILGTGGLLILAKNKGVTERIEPWLRNLRTQGYRISKALIQELLNRAGEDQNP